MSTLKPITSVDRARRRVHATSQRTKRKVGSAYHTTVGSKGGTRAESGGYDTGEKFGKPTYDTKSTNRSNRFLAADRMWIPGIAAGAVGGTAVAVPKARKQTKQIKANQATINANSRAMRQQRVAKSKYSRAYKITDVGTRASRMENKVTGKRALLRYPGSLALGAALGVPIGAAPATHALSQNHQKLQRQKRTITRQNKKLNTSEVGKRMMSDAEIRHRKKIQGHTSQATGALGLAALGGTLAASRGGRNTLRKIPAMKNKIAAPGPKDPNRDRIKSAVTPVLATSAGLGGLGAFNFASYTNAESRKRGPVKKDIGLDMGHFGEEGRPVPLEEIEVPIEKAWSPSVSNFDSERSRRRRSTAYEAAGGAATAGVGAAATRRAGKGLTFRAQAVERENKGKSGLKARKLSAVHMGRAGKLGAATAATGAATAVVHQRKKTGSWESWGKRDSASAFGVEH